MVHKVKDPNWPQVNQLAFYKRIRGDELENKSALSGQRRAEERRLNSAPPDHNSSALTAARPLCFDGKRELKINSCLGYWKTRKEKSNSEFHYSLLG